jgi:hypothetical protein
MKNKCDIKKKRKKERRRIERRGRREIKLIYLLIAI